MPVTTGLSTQGVQTVAQFQTLTLPQVELAFPTTPGLPFRRVGFLYVFALQAVTPFQTILLRREALYKPGLFLTFPSNYGFANYRYTIQVQWNESNLSWRCTTN